MIIVFFVKIGNKKIKRKHNILYLDEKLRKRKQIIISECKKTTFCWASEGPCK